MVRDSRTGDYPDPDQTWWDPIHLDSAQQDGPVLSDAQVQQWLRDGFLIVSGLW